MRTVTLTDDGTPMCIHTRMGLGLTPGNENNRVACSEDPQCPRESRPPVAPEDVVREKCIHRLTGDDIPPNLMPKDVVLACSDDPECTKNGA